ncbi:MAG TPA: hypothetical protein VGW40_11495 [Allosphingosinicella sp.]|nr:hypothetical protein [Allosphingosinicella sp.]
MNAEPATLDQALELFHSQLAAVIELAGRARSEFAGIDAEGERPKDWSISPIEGAIDKDVVGRGGGGQAQCFLPKARLTAVLASRIDSMPAFEAGLRIRPPVTALRPSTLPAPFPPLRLDDTEDFVAMGGEPDLKGPRVQHRASGIYRIWILADTVFMDPGASPG